MTTTMKQAKEQLARIDMTISKRDGEYRVAFKGAQSEQDDVCYHTNDIDDAISTAQLMRRELNAKTTLAKQGLLARSVNSVDDAKRYTHEGLQSASDLELRYREVEAREKHKACVELLGNEHAATRLWWRRVNKTRLALLAREGGNDSQLGRDIESATYALRAVVLRQLPQLVALDEIAPNPALRDVIEHAQLLQVQIDRKTSHDGKRAIMSVGAVRRAKTSTKQS